MSNTHQTPKGQYTAVNGLDMYYEIHGSGEPLVILHGAFGSAAGWDAILPTLTATRQVILLEQQGHGHTTDRDQPLFYEQMADDTAALRKQLQIQKAESRHLRLQRRWRGRFWNRDSSYSVDLPGQTTGDPGPLPGPTD
jgi:hypothetical protein